MHTVSERPRPLAQTGVELHGEAPAGAAVEYRAFKYRRAQHLLEAYRLRTQLNQVAIVRLGAAMLVFHGESEP
jgi:hypothetical protein